MAVTIFPKLEIGAGRTPKRPGWINADLYHGPNIDAAFDACGKWPFDSNSIGTVYSNHNLEHLPDPVAFFREAHRVLVPSKMANLYMRLPYGPSSGGIGDITHLKMYLPESFACFQPGYNDAVRNPQHDDNLSPWSVMAIYQRIDPALRWLVKPVIRRLGLSIIPYLWGGYIELIVAMRAIKSAEEVEAWKIEYAANTVPVSSCMYNYEYWGRPLKPHETTRLIFFGKGAQSLNRRYEQ